MWVNAQPAIQLEAGWCSKAERGAGAGRGSARKRWGVAGAPEVAQALALTLYSTGR